MCVRVYTQSFAYLPIHLALLPYSYSFCPHTATATIHPLFRHSLTYHYTATRLCPPSVDPIPYVFCCTALVKLFRRYRTETVDRMETLADENEWLRVVLQCGGDTRDSGELPAVDGGAAVNDTQGVTVWYSLIHIICCPSLVARPSCRY